MSEDEPSPQRLAVRVDFRASRTREYIFSAFRACFRQYFATCYSRAIECYKPANPCISLPRTFVSSLPNDEHGKAKCMQVGYYSMCSFCHCHQYQGRYGYLAVAGRQADGCCAGNAQRHFCKSVDSLPEANGINHFPIALPRLVTAAVAIATY
jgi:hypothetical protein